MRKTEQLFHLTQKKGIKKTPNINKFEIFFVN